LFFVPTARQPHKLNDKKVFGSNAQTHMQVFFD
jgi:hypothetical protein